MPLIDGARRWVIPWSLMGSALWTANARADCDCRCFDGRPLLICPTPPPEGLPVCGPDTCTPKPAPFAPPPAPEVKVCAIELTYNEKTKQFDARRSCK